MSEAKSPFLKFLSKDTGSCKQISKKPSSSYSTINFIKMAPIDEFMKEHKALIQAREQEEV